MPFGPGTYGPGFAQGLQDFFGNPAVGQAGFGIMNAANQGQGTMQALMSGALPALMQQSQMNPQQTQQNFMQDVVTGQPQGISPDFLQRISRIGSIAPQPPPQQPQMPSGSLFADPRSFSQGLAGGLGRNTWGGGGPGFF